MKKLVKITLVIINFTLSIPFIILGFAWQIIVCAFGSGSYWSNRFNAWIYSE